MKNLILIFFLQFGINCFTQTQPTINPKTTSTTEVKNLNRKTITNDPTQKELEEKKARIEYYKCTEPDKARIEAQKEAEEGFKLKN